MLISEHISVYYLHENILWTCGIQYENKTNKQNQHRETITESLPTQLAGTVGSFPTRIMSGDRSSGARERIEWISAQTHGLLTIGVGIGVAARSREAGGFFCLICFFDVT